MENNANVLNWFEIPVTDINRAMIFYENILGIDMGQPIEMMGMQFAFFPAAAGVLSGALAQSDMHKPSHDGATIYLNANPAGMDKILVKITDAGGQVAMPKTHISADIGYMAFFIDSEGNRIGLHSDN